MLRFNCKMSHEMDVVTFITTNCSATANAAITAWKSLCKTVNERHTSNAKSVHITHELPNGVNSRWYQMAIFSPVNGVGHMWIVKQTRGHDKLLLMQSFLNAATFQYDRADISLEEFKTLCSALHHATQKMSAEVLNIINETLNVPHECILKPLENQRCEFDCTIYDFSG